MQLQLTLCTKLCIYEKCQNLLVKNKLRMLILLPISAITNSCLQEKTDKMDISWYRFLSLQDLLASLIGFVLQISAGSVVIRDAGALVLFFTPIPCTYTSLPLDGMARNYIIIIIYLHGYARSRNL